MSYEYVLEEGEEQDFYYEGEWYVGYTRIYNTGEQDVEVYLRSKPELQVNEKVYEYAWKLFENFGKI
jgi:hypothetical protein